MQLPLWFLRSLFLTGIISLAACADTISTEVNFKIDNPTDQVITVRIDAKEFTIEPSSSKSVTLSGGIHQLDTALTGKVEFMVYGYIKGKTVLMNPTFSSYYLVSEVYAENDQSRKNFQPYIKKIYIDGVEYEWPIQVLDGLFIHGHWTYDLDENFPNEVTVYNNEKGIIKSKIFRKMNMVAYLEEQFDEIGKYAKSNPNPLPLKASYFNFEKPLHIFKYEPVETASKQLKELYTAYLENTDTNKVLGMKKAYFDARMAFTKTTAPMFIEMEKADREAYNAFVTSMSSLFGQSARVLNPQHVAP